MYPSQTVHWTQRTRTFIPFHDSMKNEAKRLAKTEPQTLKNQSGPSISSTSSSKFLAVPLHFASAVLTMPKLRLCSGPRKCARREETAISKPSKKICSCNFSCHALKSVSVISIPGMKCSTIVPNHVDVNSYHVEKKI